MTNKALSCKLFRPFSTPDRVTIQKQNSQLGGCSAPANSVLGNNSCAALNQLLAIPKLFKAFRSDPPFCNFYPLDSHGFSVVQEPVQHGAGQDAGLSF
jgi:hypothetical protein